MYTRAETNETEPVYVKSSETWKYTRERVVELDGYLVGLQSERWQKYKVRKATQRETVVRRRDVSWPYAKQM